MARILLADDDRGTRDLVRRALQTDGHDVVLAEDGNEALSALDGAGFDVLVADIEMPGLDGIELARQAIAKAGGKVCLLLISASQESLDRARSAGLAGARFVIKPFSIDAIRGEVRGLLGA